MVETLPAVAARSMTLPDVATVVSGSGLPATLARAALGIAPINKEVWGETRGAETNLARAPIFAPRRPVQLALKFENAGPVYGHPFRFYGGPLTDADAVLLVEITSRYIQRGCPEDRRIPFSLTEGAEWLGLDERESEVAVPSRGGWQRRLVRESLIRVMSVVIESYTRFAGEEQSMLWHLIEHVEWNGAGRQGGYITLSEHLAALIRAGSVTLVDGATLRQLAAADKVAARLWLYLETESGPDTRDGWRYSIFANAPRQQMGEDRYMPAIGDLLRIHRTQRRDVVRRIRKACAAITKLDPTYLLTVEPATSQGSPVSGMWTLSVKRMWT